MNTIPVEVPELSATQVEALRRLSRFESDWSRDLRYVDPNERFFWRELIVDLPESQALSALGRAVLAHYEERDGG